MEDIYHWEKNFKLCQYSDKLLNKIQDLNQYATQPIDIREVKKAIYYARKYHGNQVRQSGEPYYSHPIEVATMLAEFLAHEAPKLYTSFMIQAALLHDTIEDTDLDEETIKKIFSPEVSKHVEGLTRTKTHGKITAQESLNLLIKAKRYDTALIKLFDRVHNIQTLSSKSPEKAHKIIQETLKSFLVISESLEISSVSDLIYNECYKNSPLNKGKAFNAFPFSQNKTLP